MIINGIKTSSSRFMKIMKGSYYNLLQSNKATSPISSLTFCSEVCSLFNAQEIEEVEVQHEVLLPVQCKRFCECHISNQVHPSAVYCGKIWNTQKTGCFVHMCLCSKWQHPMDLEPTSCKSQGKFRESDFAPKNGEESDDFAAGASISCAFLLEARDSWERSFSTSSKHVCGRLGILRKELWAKSVMQRVFLQRGYCTNYRWMLDVQQGGRWFSGRFQGCDRW